MVSPPPHLQMWTILFSSYSKKYSPIWQLNMKSLIEFKLFSSHSSVWEILLFPPHCSSTLCPPFTLWSQGSFGDGMGREYRGEGYKGRAWLLIVQSGTNTVLLTSSPFPIHMCFQGEWWLSVAWYILGHLWRSYARMIKQFFFIVKGY